MQYGYKQFIDDLPEVPAGSPNYEDQLRHDMKVTASSSSSSFPDQSQAGPSQVQVAAVEVPTNDSVVSDSLTLSADATTLRDEPSRNYCKWMR